MPSRLALNFAKKKGKRVVNSSMNFGKKMANQNYAKESVKKNVLKDFTMLSDRTNVRRIESSSSDLNVLPGQSSEKDDCSIHKLALESGSNTSQSQLSIKRLDSDTDTENKLPLSSMKKNFGLTGSGLKKQTTSVLRMPGPFDEEENDGGIEPILEDNNDSKASPPISR